jgi:hypothetical protein
MMSSAKGKGCASRNGFEFLVKVKWQMTKL